jgi:toxin ParE1/3/4
MMATPRWGIVLGADAKRDLVGILDWTTRTFGKAQAQTYKETILAAIRALEEGPDIAGTRGREEIRPGLKSLHVARAGRRGRHFIIFRISAAVEFPTIQVIRILHDAMDLSKQLGQ